MRNPAKARKFHCDEWTARDRISEHVLQRIERRRAFGAVQFAVDVPVNGSQGPRFIDIIETHKECGISTSVGSNDVVHRIIITELILVGPLQRRGTIIDRTCSEADDGQQRVGESAS